MSSVTIGIIVVCLMLTLIMLGVPLALSMLSSSALGFFLIGGFDMMFKQFSSGLMANSASYSFAVIPLFMIVGVLAGETGIAAGAFQSAKTWLGRFRGGLLYATIGANTIFGACSGVAAAGTVVFSKIAYPELKKYGYDESLSMACITSAGALACMIPPSVPILTFCILAEISIGTALMTGAGAGILFTILLFTMVKVFSIIRPKKIPPVTEADRHVSMADRLSSLKLLIPIACLFALIVGGSFLGWFPATVGGAIATVAVLIYALAKRMPIKQIAHCMWDACQMFCGIYLMIIGGRLFSRFVSVTGIARKLVDAIAESGLSVVWVFVLVVIFYLFCGCIMDIMSIVIITVPVIFPLLQNFGFSEFVICVLLVFLCDLGQLTPPVGMGVFQVANVLDESPAKIFKGVAPFFLTELAMVFLVAIFPELILWLPMLLGKV